MPISIFNITCQAIMYFRIYMDFVPKYSNIWYENHVYSKIPHIGILRKPYSEIAHIGYYIILAPYKFEYQHVNLNIKIFDITWAAKVGFPSIFEFSCTRSYKSRHCPFRVTRTRTVLWLFA